MSEFRTPSTGPGQQRGATPVVGGTRGGGRRRGLLVGALLLAPLVVLALRLSVRGRSPRRLGHALEGARRDSAPQ